jgi:N-sulfoglucosamine sulfohydrolase
VGLAAGAVLRAAPSTAPAAREAAVPVPVGSRNVILLLTDDQGMHMSRLGTRGIQTPSMDRISGQGVFFRQAFSSCASCSPSRSTLLTGMYPHSNGHWRNTHGPGLQDADRQFTRDGDRVDAVGVHEDVPTLIEILNSAGYCTGITQKFHLSPPWKYPFLERYPGAATARACYETGKRFLEAAGERPFFLMANTGNTHRPFMVRDRERAAAYTVPPEVVEVPPNLPDVEGVRLDLADYLSTVQEADACVGGYLRALEETGHLDDTLIIFTSDQGYAFHRAKATVYDAGTRVPLAIAGPGVTTGAVSDSLISHVDIAPTVLEALGLDVPPGVQGQSLWPILRGDTALALRDVVFTEHNAHGLPVDRDLYPSRSVFDSRMHYIRNLMPEREYHPPADLLNPEPWRNRSHQATLDAAATFPIQYGLLQQTLHRPPEELYDLHSDPYEMHNLAEDERFRAVRESLRAKLEEWMQRTGDPGDPRTIQRRT